MPSHYHKQPSSRREEGLGGGAQKTKKPDQKWSGFLKKNSGNVLLSHTVSRAVPSALEGLTSEFGMDIGCDPSAIIAGNQITE